MSVGSFKCSPTPCPECSREAMRIQTSGKAVMWSAQIDELRPEIRECVREYLRGIWQRNKAASDAKGQQGGKS